MNTKIKKHEGSSILSVILGPLSMACMFVIASISPFNVSWAWIASSLIGVGLCLQWRWKGLLVALALLFGTLVVQLSVLPWSEWAWDIALSLGTGSIFLITILTTEEMRSIWENFHCESERHQIQKQELLDAHQKQKQELLDIHQKNSTLEKRLAEIQQLNWKADQETNAIASKIQADLAGKQTVIEKQKEHVDTLSREKKLLETTLSRLQAELELVKGKENSTKQQLEEQQVQRDRWSAEKEQLQQESQLCLEQHQAELALLEKYIKDEKVHFQLLLEEKDRYLEEAARGIAESQEYRRLNGLYKQLKEQFAEKSASVDSVRQELFYAQESVSRLEREREEWQISAGQAEQKVVAELLQSAQIELDTCHQQYQQEIEQLHGIIEVLSKNSQ